MVGACAAMAVVFLVSVALAKGAGIEEGFYFKSDDGSGQEVTNREGETLRIGTKESVAVLGTTIVSQDNENSRFLLRVNVLNNGQVFSPRVLIVAGTVYDQIGWDMSGQSAELSVPRLDAASARALARYFEAPITYREDPGYQLAVSFSASKAEFVVGEEIPVTLRIQNVGSNAFVFEQGFSGANRNRQYNFTATLDGRPLPDIGPRENRGAGGKSGDRELAPGEVLTNTVILNQWFAFDRPGTYVVRGSYAMGFKRMDGPILPNQPPREVIWTNQATGEFNVKITPAVSR